MAIARFLDYMCVWPSGLEGLWLTTLHCKIRSLPFLGLHLHALHSGIIQGKEGIEFCHLATLLDPKAKESEVNLRPMISLCLAYAANIGGTGSLIGTPPNLLLADALEEYDGQPINFLSWMGLALPQVRHQSTRKCIFICTRLRECRVLATPDCHGAFHETSFK